MAHQTAYRPDALGVSEPSSPPSAPLKFPPAGTKTATSVSGKTSALRSQRRAVPPPRSKLQVDFWTAALNLAVIALASLLGWMVGRAGWTRVATPSRPPISIPSQEISAESSQTPAAPSPPVLPPVQAAPRPAPKPRAAPIADNIPPGALVISQAGKIVFRSSPQYSGNLLAASAVASPSVEISTSPTDRYLEFRVDPEYPAAALEQHMEGRVTLAATIRSDGTVKGVRTLSGNAVLAAAAADAARHWHFKPFSPHGIPQEFQTRINVEFRLPAQVPQ